ncbi:hypothetical protein TPY_1888 [Sulfobacillus acidophilus TPY]|uniref:Uncharacterized protein n=1 Tax=Sulfobacillus acidophilus (strain ATCC 700253 / DSM 10332 / NAL) TaxID=679936 RepID=G8TSW1_SULAD|nr:hypothetical protein TPY_1888 [Sulfobacillus acidophilus TPY]AEW05576.1 hypothetical protein Sulac_2090 [Sulfobacillus acidophilus DSM 10332]
MFSRELLGYRRTEVKKRLRTIELELTQTRLALSEAEDRIAELEDALATVNTTSWALPKERDTTDGEAIEILVGPIDRLGTIGALIDSLERLPLLRIRYRLYQDGFYRVKATTTSLNTVLDGLRNHAAVHDIQLHADRLYVTPKGQKPA